MASQGRSSLAREWKISYLLSQTGIQPSLSLHRTFPAPLRRSQTAEGLLSTEGNTQLKRHSAQNQVTKSYTFPPPPPKKENLQSRHPSREVHPGVRTLEVLPLTRDVSKIGQDPTRPAPFHPPPPPLLPPPLPHILQVDHLHLHRVHLHPHPPPPLSLGLRQDSGAHVAVHFPGSVVWYLRRVMSLAPGAA